MANNKSDHIEFNDVNRHVTPHKIMSMMGLKEEIQKEFQSMKSEM